MACQYAQYVESAEFLRARLGVSPRVAVVLGSGLGGFARHMESPSIVPYESIPHFMPSTAQSHEGALYAGRVFGIDAVLMKGRHHYYEGYSTEDIAFCVRVLRLLGVEAIILTNAAGGIRSGMSPGDLMLITDHISFFCRSPLRGANLPQFGLRFPDMTAVYDVGLAQLARDTAAKCGIPLWEGIYAYLPGPQYETPAEIRALRLIGADAAGMSTVPEAIAAVHCGMRVMGISCITNLAAGLSGRPLDADEVVEAAGKASQNFEALVGGILRGIAGGPQ